MGGTTPARPGPRAVAVGLAVALVVLVVVGRLQQHLLAPQPVPPARPLALAPTTTTIPPVPVAARIRLQGDADVVTVAAAGSWVWALGGRDLVRVDPDANRVAARIRIPRSPDFYGAGLVVGAGALWVDAGDRTVRVDTRTGRVAGSVRVPVQAAASDGLWSCTAAREGGPGRLIRVDPQTLAESARIRLPRCPAALVAERGVVWALDNSGRQLLRVQANGGRVTRIGLPVAAVNFLPDEAGFGAQLAIGEGALWVVSDQIETPTRLGARVGRGVVRIDPRTARVTAVTPLDNLEPAWMALAAGAGGVWVGGAQHAGPRHGLLVDRIDPRTGRLVGAFTVARNTEGLLAAGHGSLWLATFGGRELLRLDPSRR